MSSSKSSSKSNLKFIMYQGDQPTSQHTAKLRRCDFTESSRNPLNHSQAYVNQAISHYRPDDDFPENRPRARRRIRKRAELSNQETRPKRGRESSLTTNPLRRVQRRQSSSTKSHSRKDLEPPKYSDRSRSPSYLENEEQPMTQEITRVSHTAHQLIREMQTLQAKNASLERQLAEDNTKAKCPIKYSRIDRLNHHIYQSPEERHKRIATMIKRTTCLICTQNFTRPEEAWKHERRSHRIHETYMFRAELAFALLLAVTTSDENYQPNISINPINKAEGLNTVELETAVLLANLEPVSNQPDTSINPTNKAEGLNTVELETAVLSANLEPVSSISLNDFVNDTAGKSNGFSNERGEQSSSSNGFSNWQGEHCGLPNGVAGQNSNGFSNWQGEHCGLPNGVTGQNSNGFSNWQGEHCGLPNGVAGQNSNGFSNWQGEHYGLPNGVAGQNSNGFSNWQGEYCGLPNGVAGQNSNGFSNWQGKLCGLASGVAGQNSNGISNWQGEHCGLPNGVAGRNNSTNEFFNGIGELDGVPNEIRSGRSGINGFPTKLGPHVSSVKDQVSDFEWHFGENQGVSGDCS